MFRSAMTPAPFVILHAWSGFEGCVRTGHVVLGAARERSRKREAAVGFQSHRIAAIVLQYEPGTQQSTHRTAD